MRLPLNSCVIHHISIIIIIKTEYHHPPKNVQVDWHAGCLYTHTNFLTWQQFSRTSPIPLSICLSVLQWIVSCFTFCINWDFLHGQICLLPMRTQFTTWMVCSGWWRLRNHTLFHKILTWRWRLLYAATEGGPSELPFSCLGNWNNVQANRRKIGY